MDLDGQGRDVQVGRKSPYLEEFTKDAVPLYRAAAGKRTYSAVAADLGIMAESVRTWVRKDDSQAVPGRREAGGSEAEEMARLRAENARPLKRRRNGNCSVRFCAGQPPISSGR
ncbi:MULTISPECIES: transposase [unclassified Streptomyces]|uniref:transposase n=1 Tax=unclassified Streptomyces TaxID=2593676 RepID=UPI000DBA3FE4